MKKYESIIAAALLFGAALFAAAFSGIHAPKLAGPAAPPNPSAGATSTLVNAFASGAPSFSLGPVNPGAGSSAGSPAAPPDLRRLASGLKPLALPAFPAPAAAPARASPAGSALPNVSDGELNLDPKGVATAEQYLDYLSAHYRDISFDFAKFRGALKDKNGIPLFLPDLVARAVASGNVREVLPSLEVWKSFSAAKKSFFAEIPVTGEAASLDRQMIGFEDLSIGVVGEAEAAADGKATLGDLSRASDNFVSLAAETHASFVKSSGLFAYGSNDVFGKIFAFFVGRALAALAPFGGTITDVVPCDEGFIAAIGPPMPPLVGQLFVPYEFASTPLFFAFKLATPGTWWLGLYTAPVPCTLDGDPVDFGDLIYMTGTSNS